MTEEHDSGLQPLEALRSLNTIATAFMVAQTFGTASNLGIFEFLKAGPATVEDISEQAGIHPDGGRRLLAALREIGLVEPSDGQFRNSALGAFLTSESPAPLEPLSMWSTVFARMWEHLPDALRECGPRWKQALNTTAEETFAAIYEDPARLRRFTQRMDAFSVPEGQEVAERFDFRPHTCVMDVAGGPGGFAIEIGKRYSHMRGIIMDLPEVCAIAQERIQTAGLEGRFEAVAADLFDGPYPTGADVITLGWILHDWSDENCLKILHNCHAALPAKGILLINESVLNDDYSGTEFATLMSLHMTVVCEWGARERTQTEYRSLLDQAGFRFQDVVRYGGVRDLIVAQRL